MLKLLQDKNPKYKIVNIKSIANCNEDPFKRLLNRDDYIKDLKIIPKQKNKITEEYDNSFYHLNDKYNKYLMDPWDDILLKGLYADIIEFNQADLNNLLSIKTGKGNYTDTHILLSLLLAKENNGFDKNIINSAIKNLALILVNAQNNDKIFTDLYAERVVFLYWAGFGNLVKKEWIDFIKNSQNEDLGWSGYEEEGSNPHSTALALLSIIYFKEGKLKQDFY